MSKHSKILISLFAAVSLVLGVFSGAAFAVTQEEIDAVRARRDAIAAQRQDRQAIVDQLTERRAGVLEQKAAMDARSELTLEQIELLRREIALYGERIEEKALEVAQTRAQEEQQLKRYRSRVRAMEENGRPSLLTLILQTETLGEFFTTADDVAEIMRHDKAVELAYREAREASEKARADYEAAQTGLKLREEELSREQEALRAEIDEAEALIVSLEADIASGSEDVRQILDAEQQADAELQRLMAELERQRQAELERRRREEELRRQAEEAARAEAEETGEPVREPTLADGSGSIAVSEEQSPAPEVRATGVFLWPVPGHTYITSRFGLRVHPITGTKKSHTGLDIPADTGTDIVAADGGTVTKAAVYGGYGNCVILDHGNGYVTLYGHLSRMSVSEGETVAKGQTIGLVGSTGVSTGPHCHFEIWSNGARIDPEPFFSGLSFADSAGE